MAAPSPFSKYITRDALVYYLFSLPAVAAETVFAIAITSSPDLASQVGPNGPVVLLLQLLPWLVLLASAYAILTFSPSALVTLLVASFFIAVSMPSTIGFLGAPLDLADSVFLVIAASFLALVGFSYARGLKLLGDRKLRLTSSGSVGYQALGIALESVVPLAAALVLVALVEALVGAIGVQAARLPQPLSTLSSLYLQTRFGLVFTTLLVAGAMIWVLRQVLEPIILHFTLTTDDARKELLSEIEPTTKIVRKFLHYMPSGGLGWGVIGVAYCLGVIAALVVLVPPGQVLKDLAAVFNPQVASPSASDVFVRRSTENLVSRADIAFARLEEYIREIVRLLWG